MRSLFASAALALVLTGCFGADGSISTEEARELEKHAQHNLLRLTNTHQVLLDLNLEAPNEVEEGAYYPYSKDANRGFFVLYQGRELPKNGQFEQADGRVYRFQK